MPQPTKGQVHVNRPLTNISLAFLQAQSKFVAPQVFPMIPVGKQSDQYFTYPRDAWFTDQMKRRGPGSESAGSGYDVSTASYFADVFALHKDIADQIRDNADDPIDLDREAAEFLTQKWLLRMENQFVSDYFGAGKWNDKSVGAGGKWDTATGDPVDDVEKAMDEVETLTSFRPNVAVATPDVHRALKNNPEIKDRLKITETKIVTEDLLASLFGVDKYLVARATQNIANEGATLSMQRVFGTDGFLLAYSAPNPGLYTPSAGYTFAWTGHAGATQAGQAISTFRMDHLKSDRVEIEAAFDLKLVAQDLGAFFADVIG